MYQEDGKCSLDHVKATCSTSSYDCGFFCEKNVKSSTMQEAEGSEEADNKEKGI